MEIEQTIYDTVISDGLPPNMANLIVAQAAHETGDFSSNAFIKNNNLFGYKYTALSSWQDGAGITSTEHDPYAKYKTIEDSVHEITHWIRRRQKAGKFPKDLSTMTPMGYAVNLKTCGYYGDPIQNYISGLNHFYKDYSV